MFNLKEKDVNTWTIFESGNFSMNKSEVPFSPIAAYHALEQEKSSRRAKRHR